MKNVVLVVLEGVQALDVAGPFDVFVEANTLLPEQQRYDVALVGMEAGITTCSSGMGLAVPFGYRTYDRTADLLLVAGGPAFPTLRPADDFLAWIRAQTDAAARFGAVCNGAFVLGYAGLLDGRDVTTHWSDAARLTALFPAARVQPDRIFVRDGRLYTSAGVTAGIDLCLALVAQDFGHALAVRVAKRLVVYMQREGGQSQYSPYLAEHSEGNPVVAKVHRYVLDHLAEPLSIGQLADAVPMSRRSFSRLFARSAQVSPATFVEQVRVDAARKRLEEDDAPLKTVAFECGFHSATHMRMIFSRRLGITAQQYRQRFRAPSQADA